VQTRSTEILRFAQDDNAIPPEGYFVA
jgi:hypothetical protein